MKLHAILDVEVYSMNKISLSRQLKLILILLFIFVLVAFAIVIPTIGKVIEGNNPEYAFAFIPCLIWSWCFAIPIILAFIPAWQIFSSVGSEEGCFVKENVKRFKTIAMLAYLDAIIFPLGMIIVGFLGAGQPGLTVIVTPAVIILAVCFARVFQILAKITEEASMLKEEVDLTV